MNPNNQPKNSQITSELPVDHVPKKGLAYHSLNYLLGSAIATIGGIAMLPIYTHALSTAEYGLLETALRFVSVCMVVAFLGMRQAYARFYFDDESVDRRRVLTSTTVLANIAIAFFVMFPFLALASRLTGRFSFADLTIGTSALLAVWLAFESTFLLGLSFFQVRLRSKQLVAAQGGRVILLVTLNFVMLHFFALGLKGALLGNLIAAVVSGGVAGLLLLRSSGFRISTPTLREMMSFGLPYIPAAFFGYLITNADRFAILYFGAVSSLGLLSLASKIGEMALAIFVMPVENVWSPYAFSVQSEPDGPRKIGRMYTLYSALAVLLALLVSLAAPLAITILATPSYQSAAELVPIIAIGWIFSLLATLSDIGILIAKQTRLKPFMLAGTALIAALLQCLLTPVAGIIGAALATTLTLIAFFLITRVLSNRFYRMETSSKDFLVIALAAGTAFFCGRALMHTMPLIAGSFAALAVAFAIYAFAMHKAGVITYSDVASMARSVGFGRMFDSGNKA